MRNHERRKADEKQHPLAARGKSNNQNPLAARDKSNNQKQLATLRKKSNPPPLDRSTILRLGSYSVLITKF